MENVAVYYPNINLSKSNNRKNPNMDLSKVKDIFKQNFGFVISPTRQVLTQKTTKDDSNLQDLDYTLRLVRSNYSRYKNGDESEYFRELFNMVQYFKVANCDEYAEISKTILRANGIKDCDIFCLAKKTKDGEIKPIDHAVTVVNIKPDEYDKKKSEPFIPNKDAKIVDLWSDNFIGDFEEAKKIYDIFDVKFDDTLMLIPLDSLEPDDRTFKKLEQNGFRLNIDKSNVN